MKNEQEPPSIKQRVSDSGNTLFFMACVLESAVAPFMRMNFGAEYFGVSALLAGLTLFVCAGFSGSQGFLVYLACWVVALARHRLVIRARQRTEDIVHSRYSGWPALAFKFPFVRSEATAKGMIEPVICVGMGFVIQILSVPLGTFIIVAGIAIMIRSGIERELMRVRVQRLRDAQIEQRHMNDQLYR